MSRDELLDDAIENAKKAGDWQLADWLRSARSSDKFARWATSQIDNLNGINKSLQSEVMSLINTIGEIGNECARLRGFWTHDGTWHVQVPRLPDSIAVTLSDNREREVGTARVYRYVRIDEAD